MQWLTTKLKGTQHSDSQEINGYTIVKELGRGNFGVVYLVEKSGKQYALKSIKFQDETAYIYYNNEKNILKKLPKHESLIHYVDDFLWMDNHCLVMEYIDGK